MPNADPDRDLVVAWLRNRGFEAEPIPETDERQPDIRSRISDERYVIEVKRRFDAADEVAARDHQIEVRGYAYECEFLWPTRRFYAHIRDLVEQLKAETDEDALRLGWIICDGIDAADKAFFIGVAAYGQGCVADAANSRSAPPTGSVLDLVFSMEIPGYVCNYFFESCFYSLRDELDGLVLDVDGRLQLLLNDHSPRADSLRSSTLARAIANIQDPSNSALDDHLYADCLNKRSDAAATLKYLADKYGFAKPILADMQRHRIHMRVPM